jgi:PAS domain S-box-containing protein
MDNIPQHIFWKNRDSVYLGCNRNFAEDAGIGDPASIIGKTDYDLPWKREEADFFRDYDSRVMEADAPILHIIEPQLQADGKEAWLDTNKIPLHDAAGNVVGILGTYEDITERKEYADRQKELLEREQHITAVLQQAVVPPEVPTEIGDYRIAVRYQPALREAEIGGDFYDVFDLGNGKIGILLGDVVGKGLPAAIQVSAARYTIRAYAYLDPRPGKALELANKSLFTGRKEEGGELTAFFAVLDTSINIVTYANAGQEPPVLVDAGGNIEELGPTGMLLNMMGVFAYSERSCRLNAGDRIVMITDGITEARSEDRVFFNKRGVIDHIKRNLNKSPQELADGLLAAALDHAGGGLQDDAAIVVLDLSEKAPPLS